MNKKKYNKLLARAVKEHSIADYAKALLTPRFLQNMKKIGRQRLTDKK